MFRVTADVLKFVRVLKNKVKTADLEEELLEPHDDLAQAERLWIIESQSSLTQDKLFETWRRQFNLFALGFAFTPVV